MTYGESLAVIVFGGALGGFSTWYAWCVYTMFFRCARPRNFFSNAYSTSGSFMLINVIGLVLAAAWALMKAVNQWPVW